MAGYSLVMNITAACALTAEELDRLSAHLEYAAKCLPRITDAEVTDFEAEQDREPTDAETARQNPFAL